MTLSNIVFILAVWSAVALIAGVLIGTMMASQDKDYPEPSAADMPLAAPMTRTA